MNEWTQEREPRAGLPTGTCSQRVPQRALRTCFLSSRPLQGTSAMGPRRFGENLPFRGGADSTLRVCPGIQGPAERSCHKRLQNGVRDDEVDAAPDQVHEGKAGRPAARYGGTFFDPPSCFSHQADPCRIPDLPAVRPRASHLIFSGPLFLSYFRKKTR